MKLIQAATALMATEQMAGQEWDYDLALAIVLTKKAVAEHAAFFIGEERKLMEEYAERDENGAVRLTERGTFIFADPRDAADYAKKRQTLCEVEILPSYEPIRVKAPAKIRPAHIEALEGFIAFGEATT